MWLFGQVIAFLVSARSAECPPRYTLNGVRASGRFECALTVGDNDDPPIDRLVGRVYCTPDEIAWAVDFRHVGCRKRA